MNSKNRIDWLVVMVVTAILLAVTACGGDSSELVYRATGTATEARVAYADAEGNIHEETVTLPWETSVEVSDQLDFELRVSNLQPTGDIGCEVWLEDSKVGDATHPAYVVCTGSVYLDSGNPRTFITYSVEGDLKDARSMIDEGELENALAKVESALEVAPYFADAYFVQGRVYQKMEEPDLALAAYDQAIALDPEYTGAYHNRGGIHLNRAQFELAVADFTTTIELDPEHVQGYRFRAIAYANMGELEAAKADVLKVQELAEDPELLSWAEAALAELENAD